MRLLVATLCLTAWPALGQPLPRPMTIDDEFRVVELGEPLISPDGRWVLYTTTRSSPAENARHTTTWLAPVEGSPARTFLRAGDGSPMWAPDSRSVFFVRSGQLFEQRLDGAEAIQRSRLEGLEPWLWQLSRDGRSLLAIASQRNPSAPGIETDVTFVDEGSNGQTRYAWDDVYSYDLPTETRSEERRVGTAR